MEKKPITENTSENFLKKNNRISLQPWHIINAGVFHFNLDQI